MRTYTLRHCGKLEDINQPFSFNIGQSQSIDELKEIAKRKGDVCFDDWHVGFNDACIKADITNDEHYIIFWTK